MEKLNPSYNAERMQKATISLDHNLLISISQTFTYPPIQMFYYELLTKVNETYLHKELYTNVSTRFILNSKKLQITECL